MTKHIELLVKISPLWSDYVGDILINKIGCTGVVTEEKQLKDEAVISDISGFIKGYLPLIDNVNPDNIQKILIEERNNLIESGIKPESLGSWKLGIKEIPDEEWAHNWKKYWHPMKISKKVVICPSWESYEPEENEIIISLDPGSAFGTGTHPTTRLCVRAIEKVLPEFSRPVEMADVGTGSGILAVAGVKLGVNFATGVDNDASVIPVAVENAQKNNVGNQCGFYTGISTDIDGQYEIVVANILHNILIDDMHNLKKLVKKDGKLVLSGIVDNKSQDVQNSVIANGLKIQEILGEDRWVAIIAGF